MKHTCVICRKEFSQWRKGKEPKYCSWNCRLIGTRSVICCNACGKEFTVPANQESKRQYCSKKCAAQVNIVSKKDFSKKSEFTCKFCGTVFVTWSYRKPVFCSHLCMSQYAARQPKPNARKPESFVTLKCVQCGGDYIVHKAQTKKKSGSKFCSVKCKANWTSVNKRGENHKAFKQGRKTYDRGVNWSTQRRRALRRDNSTCQVCGYIKDEGERKIDVHHITPYIEFNSDYISANRISNLITLCRSCHIKIEFGKIKCPILKE